MVNEHIQLDRNVWLLPKSGVLIDFAARDSAFSDTSFEAKSGEFKFAKWGKVNLLPQTMLDLVTRNHIKAKLLTTEEEYLYGAGLKIFKRTLVDGTERIEPAFHPDIQRFLNSFNHRRYIQRAINNYVNTANVFTEFVFNALRNVVSLKCHDSTDVRAGIIDLANGSGEVEQYGICPDWSKTPGEKNPLVVVDAYRPGQMQAKCIFHASRERMGQKYYSYPDWWGTMTWTEVSNLIPLFHRNGLKNGYNIKYLIKVPKSYFDRMANTDEEREAKRRKLREDFDSFFAGAENADKTIWSTYDLDASGRQQPGIVVETVGQTDSDKSYIELDRQANMNQAVGHGVLPQLAGIGDGSNKGTSGSELRIVSQLHTALKTPMPRQVLLEPFEIVARHNGWPAEYFVAFSDIEITTLDQNPTGKQRVVDNGQNNL